VKGVSMIAEFDITWRSAEAVIQIAGGGIYGVSIQEPKVR
jgi:hypothetical protein